MTAARDWKRARPLGALTCELVDLAARLDATAFEIEAKNLGFDGAVLLEAGAVQCGMAWRVRRSLEAGDRCGECGKGNQNRGMPCWSCGNTPADRLEVFAVLPGTADRADIWADLRSVWRDDWPGILPKGVKVGVGFRDQAAAIGPLIKAKLDKLDESHTHAGHRLGTVLGGHSLGGAISCLLNPFLVSHGYRPTVTYAFESPRVGGKRWAAWFDESTINFDAIPLEPGPLMELYKTTWGRVWRPVNYRDGVRDIIVGAPPSCRPFSAWHAGTPVMLLDGRDEVGRGHWNAYREANPLPWWHTLRVVTAGLAHLLKAVLAKMRRKIQPTKKKER